MLKTRRTRTLCLFFSLFLKRVLVICVDQKGENFSTKIFHIKLINADGYVRRRRRRRKEDMRMMMMMMFVVYGLLFENS